MSQMFPKLSPSVFANNSQAVSHPPSTANTAVNRLKMLKQPGNMPSGISLMSADTVQLQGTHPAQSVSFGRDFSQNRQNNATSQPSGISPLRVIAKTGIVMAATVLGGLVGGPWLALGAGLIFGATLLYSALNPDKKAKANAGWPEHHMAYRTQTEPTGSMQMTHVAQPRQHQAEANPLHPASSASNPKLSMAPLPHWAKEGIPTLQLTKPVAYIVLDRHQGTATLVMQKPGEAEPLIIKKQVNFLHEPASDANHVHHATTASASHEASHPAHEATPFHPFHNQNHHNQG